MKMNKKGEENDGGSITGVVGYLIILVALLVLVVFQTTSSGKVKDVGEELFNLDEIKKIVEEELTDEQKLELAEMRKVSSMLKEKIDSDGRDCIIPLDFSEYNEDFIINFFRNSGRGFVGVTKEHADFDAREPLLSNVYFNSFGNDYFAINEFRNLMFNGERHDLGEEVFIYKALNGDVYFYSGIKLIEIKSNLLNCEDKKLFDDLSDKRIKGEIDEVGYLISLFKLYADKGLVKEAISTYYLLVKGSLSDLGSGRFRVTQGQWDEIEPSWLKIVGNAPEGEWYLCRGENNIRWCFDFTIQALQESQGFSGAVENAIRQNCNVGINEIIYKVPGSISPPWFNSLEDCESERLLTIE